MMSGHEGVRRSRGMARAIGRGAYPAPGSGSVRARGAQRKANVGMSNDNGGAKPPRRKTKGS